MIVRDIVERPTAPPVAPAPPAASSSGFPPGPHRSQRSKPTSAFARARRNDASGPSQDAAPSRSTASRSSHGTRAEDEAAAGPSTSRLQLSEADRIRLDVDATNATRVEGMSAEERAMEVSELEERFGGRLLDALRRRAETRQGRGRGEALPGGGREAADFSIHQSPAGNDDEFKTTRMSRDSAATAHASTAKSPSQTTPSDLERYFPDTPAEPAKLAWLSATSPEDVSKDSSPRFDLSGQLLSREESEELPTHLGLHHHGKAPDLAGYTLEEVLMLCRSTVAGQRGVMMRVLGRILGRYDAAEEGPPIRAQRRAGTNGNERGSREEEVEEPKAARTSEVQAELKKSSVIPQAIELALNAIMTERSISVLCAAIELLYEALGGGRRAWLKTYDAKSATNFDTEAFRPEEPHLASLPYPALMPRLHDILTPRDYLPPASVRQLLAILRRATFFSAEMAEAVCPIVPSLVQHHVAQVSWPASGQAPVPSLEALKLLRETVESSRACAEAISGAGISQPLLKYVVALSWGLAHELYERTMGLGLEVVKIYIALGRYGLGASVATESQQVWTDLGKAIRKFFSGRNSTSGRSTSPMLESRLSIAYWDLLSIWTTCAIDPHRTTPEHDLTWSAVSAFGWAEEAIDVATPLIHADQRAVLSGVLRFLRAYLEGCRVNEVDGGNAAAQKVARALEEANLVGELRAYMTDNSQNADPIVPTMSAAVRLQRVLDLAGEDVLSAELIGDLLTRSRYDGQLLPASTRCELLHLARIRALVPDVEWAREAFALMEEFRPAEEPLALDLLDDIIRADWAKIDSDSDVAGHLARIGHGHGLELLRPLLSYTVLPSLDDLVAPVVPNPTYLKVSTTLRPPALPTSSPPSTSQGTQGSFSRAAIGLPLRPDWLVSPLSELLRSAESPAIAQSPPDWTPSEIEIVRATLLLARIRLLVAPSLLTKQEVRCEIMFGAMQVYMLEHEASVMGPGAGHAGDMAGGGQSDVFRDELVAELLGELLRPLTMAGTRGVIVGAEEGSNRAEENTPAPLPNLERISQPFLVERPFLQWYTDLLTLFESISYGDPLFASLLIAPLAMSYPTDHRRLLWVEHPSALRLVRTKVEDVPLERCPSARSEHADPGRDRAGGAERRLNAQVLQPFLEPLEDDAEVLAGYARALGRGWVGEKQEVFLRIAVHHLAGNLWGRLASLASSQAAPDPHARWGKTEGKKQGLKPASVPSDLRKMLLAALLSAPDDVVKRVLRHPFDWRSDETVSAEEVDRRKEEARRILGPKALSRVAGL